MQNEDRIRRGHAKEHSRSEASCAAMRICATLNGEQRVQVLIPVVQGLSQKQQQLMQQEFELVDWQGLKLPSAERRQRYIGARETAI